MGKFHFMIGRKSMPDLGKLKIEDKEIVVHAIFDNRQDPEKLP